MDIKQGSARIMEFPVMHMGIQVKKVNREKINDQDVMSLSEDWAIRCVSRELAVEINLDLLKGHGAGQIMVFQVHLNRISSFQRL